MTKYISAIDTAKLVRAALKENFPGTKFSVRTSKYSGGAALHVTWTDGLGAETVDAAMSVFEGSKPDWSGDYLDPVIRIKDGERIQYGADHIFTQRTVSDAVYAAIEPEVLAALELETADYGQSYPVPVLVLQTCKHWHYERATIREFVRGIANSRAEQLD